MQIKIIKKPAKIKKEIDRIQITEIDINTGDKNITHFKQNELDVLIIMNDSVSFTKGAVDLLTNKEVVFINNNEITSFFININKSPTYHKLDELLYKCKKRKHVAYIFCNGVTLNKIKILRRLNESRKNKDVYECIKHMQERQKKIRLSKDTKEMKAHEGIASSYYYVGLSKIIKCFDGCRDKKNTDIFNILLNLNRSIIRTKIMRLLIKNQLNPCFGFLHYQKDRNEPFLVWDFAELFLHYADKKAIYLIQKRIIKQEDCINGKLKKEKLIKVFEEMNNLKDKTIQQKIDEFIRFLKGKNRFGWK